MTRDLELWRLVLLKVEELPPGRDLNAPLQIDGYDDEVISEHVRLLDEAGFIESQIIISPNYLGMPQVEDYVIFRLLNDGHDFVANAKNPAIWKKTIDFLSNKGGDVSLAVFKGVLAKMASDYLGL
jgi:hypothetical protein